jgi:hypothetical protein
VVIISGTSTVLSVDWSDVHDTRIKLRAIPRHVTPGRLELLGLSVAGRRVELCMRETINLCDVGMRQFFPQRKPEDLLVDRPESGSRVENLTGVVSGDDVILRQVRSRDPEGS